MENFKKAERPMLFNSMRRETRMGNKVKFAAVVILCISCSSNGKTYYLPTSSQSPEPTPVASPSPTPTPNTSKVFEIWGSAGSCLSISYNGEASYALIETSYRNIDSQQNSGHEQRNIPKGEVFTRCFGISCIEADAEQVGVKPIGGIWFDKNMNPVSSQQVSDSCKRVTPTPSPSPSPSPKPSPTPTPTPSPSPTPCPKHWKKCK